LFVGARSSRDVDGFVDVGLEADGGEQNFTVEATRGCGKGGAGIR